MSTSYYMKNKQNKELDNILEQIPYINVREAAYNEYYKETKIGQTSMGWVFLVMGDVTLEELHDKLQDKEIIDEYGRARTVEEMFELIELFSDKKRRIDHPEYFENREEVFNGSYYKYDIMKGGH